MVMSKLTVYQGNMVTIDDGTMYDPLDNHWYVYRHTNVESVCVCGGVFYDLKKKPCGFFGQRMDHVALI